VSVYTACTTYHWAPHLAPDPAGVLKEGGRPEDFTPPYCPGAPLDESGAAHPNAAALRVLATFTRWFGRELRSATAEPAALLVADPVAAAATAWPEEPGGGAAPLSTAAAAAVRWLVRDGVETDVVRPDDAALAAGRPGTWLVPSGSAMAREAQRRLAAAITVGRRCVVVGPLPERDEAGRPYDVLARAIRAGGPGHHVPLPATDGASAAGLVHAVLAGRDTGRSPAPESLGVPGGPDVPGGPEDDGRLLVLRRTNPAGAGTTVLYLFDRSGAWQEYSGRVAGTPVTVPLAPHGVAILVLTGGELAGFLANRGTAATRPGPSSLLTVGEEQVRLGQAGQVTGRRGGTGWELLSR
jgi:hypothetical protein